MKKILEPLDQKYLDQIFTDLGRLEIQLDSDPLVYGPKRLNEKTALARKMLTQCEHTFLEVSQKLAYYKRTERAATLILDLAMKDLLANNPVVRSGRAVSEREAIATGMLKEEVETVAHAQNAIEELEAVMGVIKAKRSDMRDIQGRLRDQIRLCQEEIGLGSRWGSKSPRPVELQPGQGYVRHEDLDHLDSVLQGVKDAETHLLAETDTTDTDDEVLASLTASAEAYAPPAPLAFDDNEALPPKPAQVPARDVVIQGVDLVAEFGFVPHCDVCGEVQSRCFSGMTCPNGHGGVDSVPPPSNPLDDEGTAMGTLLPSTTDTEEVMAFLAIKDGNSAPKKSRRQVEEEDEMDIESLLMNFGD